MQTPFKPHAKSSVYFLRGAGHDKLGLVLTTSSMSYNGNMQQEE